MTKIFTVFATIAFLPLLAQAAQPIAHCTTKLRPSDHRSHGFAIHDVGQGSLLPAGLYITFRSMPSNYGINQYRVRAGEAALRERVSGLTGPVSLEGLRISAVGVEPTTTPDNRGEHVLVIQGSQMRVGESRDETDRPDDFEVGGKYEEFELQSCR